MTNTVGRLADHQIPRNRRRPEPWMQHAGFSRTLHRVICWVCGNPVAEFLLYGIPPRYGRCPHCGAKPRNRALHWYLRELVRPRLDAKAELLEVGGSRVGVERLSAEGVIGSARYTAIDLRSLKFHACIKPPNRFIRMDVTNMEFADNSFDVILCNHTLPYVRDDARALAEIFRCLKSDGLAMLNSSHDDEKSRSVAEYRRQHPRLDDDYFAENGDQWVYGQDYFVRLESAGFRVRVDVLFDECTSEFKHRHGLKRYHEVIVAFKSAEGTRRFSPPGNGGRSRE